METATAPQKKNPVFIIILALLVIGGGWFGISKYLHGQKHEETDDAQISADITPIIPRVSGYIAKVYVSDNQYVKKGDTLLVIDDRDYQVRLEQAKAALTAAQANLGTAEASTKASQASISSASAGISTVDAQIEAAKVTLWRAQKDFDRYANLIKEKTITQQQYEQALAAKESAEKQVAILQQQKAQVVKQVSAVSAQSNATAQQIGVANAAIQQRKTEIAAAELNLSYTVITALHDGLISKVPVHAGQFVQPGQSLFSIVHSDKVWVTANFKETQLNKMIEGQKVVVKADVFPDHEFEATLSSIAPATGSTFALLPPDNASGNFVKVVQRIPVKIEFNKSDSLVKKLRPGMNVIVDVHLN